MERPSPRHIVDGLTHRILIQRKHSLLELRYPFTKILVAKSRLYQIFDACRLKDKLAVLANLSFKPLKALLCGAHLGLLSVTKPRDFEGVRREVWPSR